MALPKVATGGYHDARRREAAYRREMGWSQRAAAESAGTHRMTVNRWEVDQDSEYWYWRDFFQRQVLRTASSEALARQRHRMQPRLSGMDEDTIAEYCQTHNITRFNFEMLLAKEDDRIVRVAKDVRSDFRGAETRRSLTGEKTEGPLDFMQIILGLLDTVPSTEPWEDEEDEPPPFPGSVRRVIDVDETEIEDVVEDNEGEEE